MKCLSLRCFLKFSDMNRFKVIFALWVVLLAWCVFISTSTHMNVIVIVFAFLGSLVWFAHIEENMNENEVKFLEKLFDINK